MVAVDTQRGTCPEAKLFTAETLVGKNGPHMHWRKDLHGKGTKKLLPWIRRFADRHRFWFLNRFGFSSSGCTLDF